MHCSTLPYSYMAFLAFGNMGRERIREEGKSVLTEEMVTLLPRDASQVRHPPPSSRSMTVPVSMRASPSTRKILLLWISGRFLLCKSPNYSCHNNPHNSLSVLTFLSLVSLHLIGLPSYLPARPETLNSLLQYVFVNISHEKKWAALTRISPLHINVFHTAINMDVEPDEYFSTVL